MLIEGVCVTGMRLSGRNDELRACLQDTFGTAVFSLYGTRRFNLERFNVSPGDTVRSV